MKKQFLTLIIFKSEMQCSNILSHCVSTLSFKYLQNILYFGHCSHNFCLSLSKTILSCEFESLSSWLFVFCTRFALKCQIKIDSWKKGFSSGTLSQLIKKASAESQFGQSQFGPISIRPIQFGPNLSLANLSSFPWNSLEFSRVPWRLSFSEELSGALGLKSLEPCFIVGSGGKF